MKKIHPIRPGDVFGKLTVIEDSGERVRGQVIWKCRCECGNEIKLHTKLLRSGHWQSCGCDWREKGIVQRQLISPGDVFGKLTVIEDSGERIRGQVVWKCRCECGNEITLHTKLLRSGHWQSCGCDRPDKKQKTIERVHPGDQFGKLTVIEDSGERRNGAMIWKCRCECGNEVLLTTYLLKSGRWNSCGCESRNRDGLKKRLIQPGDQFGKLTVIEDTGMRLSGTVKWRCRCECGKEVTLTSRALSSNRWQSCGCARHDVKLGMNDLTERRFGRLVAIRPTGKASKSCGPEWLCLCDCGKEITTNSLSLVSGITKSCGCLRSEESRKRLMLTEDTSIRQLETATTKMYVHNSSGYRGVTLQRKTGKWVARAQFQKKIYSLGRYDKIEDAVEARRRFEEETIKPFIAEYYEEHAEQKPKPDVSKVSPARRHCFRGPRPNRLRSIYNQSASKKERYKD